MDAGCLNGRGGDGKFPILPLISRVNCCHIDWPLYHWSRWVLWSLLSLIADRLRRTIWPDSFVRLTASQGQRVIGQIWCAQGALWDILRSWKRRCIKPDFFSRRRPTHTNNPETHKPTRTPPQLLKYTSISWTCICNGPDCIKIDGETLHIDGCTWSQGAKQNPRDWEIIDQVALHIQNICCYSALRKSHASVDTSNFLCLK